MLGSYVQANVTFAKKGPCSQYANMVHSYAWNHVVDNTTGTPTYVYTDMYNASCLNGWAMVRPLCPPLPIYAQGCDHISVYMR